MTKEKWADIRGMVQDAFPGVEIIKESLAEPEVGEVEFVYFKGPLGKMKLEFKTKPAVIDKRTHGSRRIGSQSETEYIYSKDEFVNSLKAYKWGEVEDDWIEIDMKNSFKL